GRRRPPSCSSGAAWWPACTQSGLRISVHACRGVTSPPPTLPSSSATASACCSARSSSASAWTRLARMVLPGHWPCSSGSTSSSRVRGLPHGLDNASVVYMSPASFPRPGRMPAHEQRSTTDCMDSGYGQGHDHQDQASVDGRHRLLLRDQEKQPDDDREDDEAKI